MEKMKKNNEMYKNLCGFVSQTRTTDEYIEEKKWNQNETDNKIAELCI